MNWHAVVDPWLVLAVVLTAITQAIQIGAYAARYAGVITGRIATAISLFSLFVTASRLAALFITPAMGHLADTTAAAAVGPLHHLSVPEPLLAIFGTQMRLIVASGTVGVLLGGLLMPLFLTLFVRGIRSFERSGSIPHALARLFNPRVQVELIRSMRVPPASVVLRFAEGAVPRRLLIANTILWAVYAIGVVSAYYASVLNLDARTTATGLSGLVNGIGTVLFSIFVDPTSALIVDQTVRGDRPQSDVRSMIFWLIVTAFIGTALAQLILYPAAQYIAAIAHLFVCKGSLWSCLVSSVH
jgi:hypothetical protein